MINEKKIILYKKVSIIPNEIGGFYNIDKYTLEIIKSYIIISFWIIQYIWKELYISTFPLFITVSISNHPSSCYGESYLSSSTAEIKKNNCDKWIQLHGDDTEVNMKNVFFHVP